MVRNTQMTKVARAALGSLRDTSESFHVDGYHLVCNVATDLYESLDTPISLSCEILLRHKEFKQLCERKVAPSDYSDPFRFRDDYQAVSLLKKCPFEDAQLEPRLTAIQKFWEAEDQCKVTNLRIRHFLSAPEPSTVSSVVRNAFSIAGRKIEEILGSLDHREWLHSCRFGPGTFNSPVHRGLTSVYDKLQVTPTVTHDFAEPGAVLISSSPQWARSILDNDTNGFWPIVKESDLLKVPGNRVTFVAKTAITDRAIAIEPLVNIYAQKGLGKIVGRKLKRYNINLKDQTPNQRAALKGSLDGSLATVDLSSASDTVAKELVRAIFPDSWYSAFNSCRSKTGELDGKPIVYEKFSSMGNGFTFELESLIFYAFSFAACVITNSNDRDVIVFGDDIIIPTSAYSTLEEILTFFGFKLNREKSFGEGPFRESCGKDYYEGYDVRPLFIKGIPQDLAEVFTLANGLRHLANRRNSFLSCDRRVKRAWTTVLKCVPQSIRRNCLVPAHAGDTDGFCMNWDEAQQSNFVVPHKNGWEGYVGLRYESLPTRVREASNFLGVVATQLYRLGDGIVNDYSPAYPRQGRDAIYRLQCGAFYGPWTEFGEWY